MEKLLEGRDKFVLVLDAVDKLREGGGTLIAALGRLGEMVCSDIYVSTYRILTARIDTKPFPHPDDNPPTCALGTPFVIGILLTLSIICAQRTSYHTWCQPTEDLPSTTHSRSIPRLYTRSRCRRRHLAMGSFPTSRLRFSRKTHRKRPHKLQELRNATMAPFR
jgi:hypothetical protein